MMYAAKFGKINVLKKLIKQGAKISAVDKVFITLHHFNGWC